MLDIQVIREHPERVKNALQRRGESIDLDKIIDFDERRKVVIQERDELRGRRNSVSKKIGALKTKPQELISEMRDIGDRIKTLEAETRNIEDDLSKTLLYCPIYQMLKLLTAMMKIIMWLYAPQKLPDRLTSYHYLIGRLEKI